MVDASLRIILVTQDPFFASNYDADLLDTALRELHDILPEHSLYKAYGPLDSFLSRNSHHSLLSNTPLITTGGLHSVQSAIVHLHFPILIPLTPDDSEVGWRILSTHVGAIFVLDKIEEDENESSKNPNNVPGDMPLYTLLSAEKLARTVDYLTVNQIVKRHLRSVRALMLSNGGLVRAADYVVEAMELGTEQLVIHFSNQHWIKFYQLDVYMVCLAAFLAATFLLKLLWVACTMSWTGGAPTEDPAKKYN